MENQVIEACKEALNNKSVVGVMAVDEDGLCLYSHGLSEQLSGVIRAIVDESKELEGDKHLPTIEIGMEKGRLLVAKHNRITSVIYKNN